MGDGRCDLRYPDTAGYPDGMGFLDQGTAGLLALLREVTAGLDEPTDEQDYEIAVARVDAESLYAATVGGHRLGWVGYEQAGRRVNLVTTTVEPAFRGRGLAAGLIAAVLDSIRDRAETITVECSTIGTFLDTHPEYWDLVDRDDPGGQAPSRARGGLPRRVAPTLGPGPTVGASLRGTSLEARGTPAATPIPPA